MPLQLAPISPPTGYVRPQNEVLTEWPKWVHFADGRKSVLVDSAEEEAALLAGGEAPAPKQAETSDAPITALVGENDELTMLRKIAADKGIHVDGRWKLSKVRAAVEAASPKAEKG